MDNFFDQILSIFAPLICKGCGKPGKALCESCFFNINEDLSTKCVACETELSPEILAKNGNLCEKCARELPFQRIFVVGERAGALLRLVDEFKYVSERADAEILAKLLDQKLPEISRKTVVTFITTSAPHVRGRGFDHAKLMAKKFAKIRKLKFAKLLIRKTSASQHDKNARERKILAEKMFKVREIRGKFPEKILLIDDIWTTGSTSVAAAKLLKNSGAKSVELAIIARQKIGVHHKDLARKTAKMEADEK